MMLTVTKILSLFVYPLSLGLFFVGLSLWGQLRGNRAAASERVLPTGPVADSAICVDGDAGGALATHPQQ